MDAREQHTAFDAAHPAVVALYVAFALGLTMFSFQPVLIALSLAGGFAYCCCARGWRASLDGLRWQLPLIALIAVVNPLFVSAGSTELFRLGSRAVYAESLCYGVAMGGLFVASVLWFQAAGVLLGYEKVMALFGNIAPTIALMISMCMRLIPRFVRQGRQIAGVQDVALARAGAASDAPAAAHAAKGADAKEGAERRGARFAVVRTRLRQSTVLMGWAMEDSLQTADAMRARGWGAGRRTTYTRYRFTSADAGAMLVLTAMGVLCAAVAYTATEGYSFYPVLSGLSAWWGYVPYAVWMFLPTLLHGCEEARFR